MQDLPLTRDLVLVGGGHTHALLLRRWGMGALPGVRVTLINPGPVAAYSGMLPGFVAGHYTRAELDIDLVKLARFAGARWIDGAATGIDREARTVEVPGRPPVAYDALSLDIGITSEMPDLPGFAEHGHPAKPLGPFAEAWERFVAGGGGDVAVIGGGVAGSELAMAMAHRLKGGGAVHLLDRAEIGSGLGEDARRRLRAALKGTGVTLHEGAEIEAVTEQGVRLAGGSTLKAAFVTGAAGARAHPWLAGTGLDLHEGYVTVTPQLQSSDPRIFAAGDCAHLAFDPRPKAGVYAVRQAPVLYDNLRAVLSGGALESYRPQKDYLKLVSLGRKAALAERFGRAWSGGMLWRLKDRIDRRFMEKFDDLPAMDQPSVPRTVALGMQAALGEKPMCGGCGAKVGRRALKAALDGLPPATRHDVESLPGDDAALLRVGGARQVISTDHLRAMVLDPVAMTRIGAQHALNDIWAMAAEPQAATVSLILPRMSADLHKRTLTEIMAAAREVMDEAGAAIVGGHTSVGAELTVGFTVTGLVEAPVTLAGARPGDRLLLTKPLGSGTIMAGEMAGQAPGAAVQAALALMQHGQGAASRLLAGAHAMTDVTGFGLAGHLAGICEASGMGARVDLAAVPLMDGAEALAEAGVRSSIFIDNMMGAGQISGPATAAYDLLFDPQTAGGLLAAVPQERAEGLLRALREAGYGAALIGEIVEGAGITVR